MNKVTLKDFHNGGVDLIDLTVELFENEDKPDMIGVCISNDGSSSCEYYVKTIDEIGPLVSEYITNYYLDMKDNQVDDTDKRICDNWPNGD